MTEAIGSHRSILGEGPLWHPERQQLFWFDILSKQLHTLEDGTLRSWSFEHHCSAAGWVDRDTLLVASEVALSRFDIASGALEPIVPLEADMPHTRSNDGRADLWGGFWAGTMGKAAEPGAGSIHRFYKGEVGRIFTGLTITNAICFAPDRSCAYFADTDDGIVRRVPLDPKDGWPAGDPEAWLDLKSEGRNPDGAVTDSEGNVWIALWGAGCVACYDAQGRHLRDVPLPARYATCPAWGGSDLTDLYCTTAQRGGEGGEPDRSAAAGQTFLLKDMGNGRAEPRVIL